MKFEDVVIIFLRDLKTKLCKHNQKEVASAYYINVYAKGVLINDFFYVETSDTNLIERLSSPHLTQNLLKFRVIQKTELDYTLVQFSSRNMFLSMYSISINSYILYHVANADLQHSAKL